MHPTKLMLISQLHIFAILSTFSPFLHSPPLLLSFGYSPQIARQPPTMIAFMLYQVSIILGNSTIFVELILRNPHR
jgi:STE24 endopeptidase